MSEKPQLATEVVRTLEANKEIVRRHFHALNTRNYSELDEIHRDDGRNHAHSAFDLSDWPPEGRPFGPDDVRGTFEWLVGAFSDIQVEVLELLAEADKVVARIRMIGTHDGQFVGLPPTGRRWDYEHIHVFRIEGGQIVEHWAVREDLKAMLQLEVVGRPHP